MNTCLLFDCDGTLVDSERLCNIGLVKMFKEYGVALELEEMVKEFKGFRLSTILEILSVRYELNLPSEFIPKYRLLVEGLFNLELKPIEGIEFALENLKHTKAVVSSGPREKILHALSICNLSKYFGSNIFSSYEIGIWKPDPEIYLHAARSLGYLNSNCIVIEDGIVGIEAGVKAGMRTLFYNPYSENCPYSSVESFKSMKELPTIVNT